MKADLSGIMRSVAPVLAMRRLVRGRSLLDMNAIECVGGVLRRVMTSFGSCTVRTPFGLMGDMEQRQLVVTGGKSGLKMSTEV